MPRSAPNRIPLVQSTALSIGLSLALSTALFIAPSPVKAVDACEQAYAEHLATDLALDYTTFDQTPSSGFRALAEQGCPAEAADLIEAYIEANDATQGSLVWHVAQLRGEAGDIPAAIDAARRSMRESEQPGEPFRWNAHVRAYLAVLEGNRGAFDEAREELAAAVDDHPGNAMNLRMWDRLAPHFDAGYAAAVKLAYSQD